jgi:hypothetical protein
MRASGIAGARWRAAAAALAVLAPLVSAACTLTRSPAAALEPYAAAPLEPGRGLGDLRLGATTLQPFVERFPGGRVSVTAGDELGIELGFPAARVDFLFALDEECAARVASNVRKLAADLADPPAFFAEHPPCARASLRSIAVAAGESNSDTFYRGATPEGVGLFTLRQDALARHGPNEDVRGLWLAASSPDDARFETIAHGDGLVLYIGEVTDGELAGRLVVRKMAVFTPDGR